MFQKDYIKKLFASNPTMYGLLKDAEDLEMARSLLRSHIGHHLQYLSRKWQRLQSLEFALQNQCLNTFRKMLSVRSEEMAGFSMLELLWKLAKEDLRDLPDTLSDGFFEEMIHMFYALRGKTGIYDSEAYPEYVDLQGREASIERSRQLDIMAQSVAKQVSRYPTGLDEAVVEKRRQNSARIMQAMGSTEREWNDYHWHLKRVIRDEATLSRLIDLTDDEARGIREAVKNDLPFAITPYYVSLMDKEPSRRFDHAVRAQVIPPLNYVETVMRNSRIREHSADFMLEHNTSPIELITRRYPMIVILKPFNSCSQFCVYCQRNWEITGNPGRALASNDKLQAAIAWIAEHNNITEVLVTGGDPLMMSSKTIDRILRALSEIDHIECIRIGSRMPVVLPQRFTQQLIETIAAYHRPGFRAVSMVTHFEHPYEVTPESMDVIQRLKQHGISTYNQAVFTVENSRRFEMVALRRTLRLIGVDPYYTFNTKGKEETRSYRVPMARLRQEIKEEARLIPGLMRTDEPVYNVPGLGKNYVRAGQHHSLLAVLPNGRRVYEFHPWEKNLSLADTFVDTDVSIYKYLQELERRGENIEEYRTIWYYY